MKKFCLKIGIFVVAIISIAILGLVALNAAVNLKNGEYKNLFNNNQPAIEQTAEQTLAE